MKIVWEAEHSENLLRERRIRKRRGDVTVQQYLASRRGFSGKPVAYGTAQVIDFPIAARDGNATPPCSRCNQPHSTRVECPAP